MDNQQELNKRIAMAIGDLTIQLQAVVLERETLRARVQELEIALALRNGGPPEEARTQVN